MCTGGLKRRPEKVLVGGGSGFVGNFCLQNKIF